MREAGLTFDRVCTSYLSRATETLDIVQKEMGAGHVPTSRSWRLNERHYGALQVRGTARAASGDAAAHDSAPRAPQGLNKQETLEKHGAEQVVQWRRSYDVPPPPLDRSDPSHPSFDPLYREVDSSLLPSGESLELTAQRVLPEWNAVLAPAIREGQRLLVVAHGNSLRALAMHLDRIPKQDIVQLNIPTGARRTSAARRPEPTRALPAGARRTPGVHAGGKVSGARSGPEGAVPPVGAVPRRPGGRGAAGEGGHQSGGGAGRALAPRSPLLLPMNKHRRCAPRHLVLL